jgi:hypothetical protein
MKNDFILKAESLLHGRVIRIGGKVDHIRNWRGMTVEDLNIENRKAKKYGSAGIGRIRYAYECLEQEIRFWRRGYGAVRDRKTVFIDSHDIIGSGMDFKKYNGCISSNVVEHSPNPIWLMVNLHSIVKDEGYHFHAIPHYATIFDWYRTPTSLDHFIDDFKGMRRGNDSSHDTERMKAAEKNGVIPDRKTMRYPYAHYHVFNEENTRQLFELVFTDVSTGILKTHHHDDVGVLFKNGFNDTFLETFRSIIDRYKDYS